MIKTVIYSQQNKAIMTVGKIASLHKRADFFFFPTRLKHIWCSEVMVGLVIAENLLINCFGIFGEREEGAGLLLLSLQYISYNH